MNTNDHKKTALRRVVLIGLALSATMWTTGMAETNYPSGISGNGTFGEEDKEVTIQADGTAISNSNNQQNIIGDTVTISSNGNISTANTGVVFVQGTGISKIEAADKITIAVNGPGNGQDFYGAYAKGLNAQLELTSGGNVNILGGKEESPLKNSNYYGLRGNVAINAANGDIHLESYMENDSDKIKRNVGLQAYGTTSKMEFNAENLQIITSAKGGIASGLYSQTSNGMVNAQITNDIFIQSKGEGANGIDFSGDGNNQITLHAGRDLTIDSISENTGTTLDAGAWGSNSGAYGIQTQYNKIDLFAGNTLTIHAEALDQNYSYGIWAKNQDTYKEGGLNSLTSDNIVNISAELTINSFDK